MGWYCTLVPIFLYSTSYSTSTNVTTSGSTWSPPWPPYRSCYYSTRSSLDVILSPCDPNLYFVPQDLRNGQGCLYRRSASFPPGPKESMQSTTTRQWAGTLGASSSASYLLFAVPRHYVALLVVPSTREDSVAGGQADDQSWFG